MYDNSAIIRFDRNQMDPNPLFISGLILNSPVRRLMFRLAAVSGFILMRFLGFFR